MMRTTRTSDQVDTQVLFLTEPQPPVWVSEWLGEALPEPIAVRHDLIEARIWRGESFSRVEMTVGGVGSMDILTFQQTVAESYRAVFDLLATLSTPCPVRFWAFVPDIHAGMGPGLDRYMAFNAGRFAAYSAWCGGRDAFGEALTTASAVGVAGDRLVLNCLAGKRRGVPVENPRQIPAYRYSRRFGPLPPCFARATRVECGPGNSSVLLVGGTASICGEDSLYPGELEAQALETFRNLASLVRCSCSGDETGDALHQDWLERFRELRIYRPREPHTPVILGMVEEHFPALNRIELLRAELCRADLLVEIEGLADLN